MKTAELIEALAASGTPVPARPVMRQLVLSALVGGAAAAVIVVFGLGLRPLDAAVQSRMFWMKAGYTLILAAAGWLVSGRLARPGGVAGWAPALAAAGVLAMAVMGAMDLAHTSPTDLSREWLGESWRLCPWYILGLAVPVYLALAVVMRRTAPTRLRTAGAAAGLFSGGVAGAIYGLHCPESAAAFVATWYTLGIATSVALGWLAGPRLLRW